MLIKQKIIVTAVLVVSIAILSDIYKVHTSTELKTLFDTVVESETPSLTSLIEIKSSARQASLKAVEFSIRGTAKDKEKTREAIDKIRLYSSNYLKLKRLNHDFSSENETKLTSLVNGFIQTTEDYLDISEGPSLSQLTLDESELHKARKNLIYTIGSVNKVSGELTLEKIKSEARKISIKSIEFYLRGRVKDHDKANESIKELNKYSVQLVKLMDRDSIAKVVVSVTAYTESAKKYLIDIAQRKSPVTTIYSYEENLNKSRKKLIHVLYDLIKIEQDELSRANKKARNSIESLINITIMASVVLILTIIIFSTALYRTISRPISSLIEATRKVGSGDLDTRTDIKSNDEIKVLADAFNAMTEQLKLSQAEREQALSSLQAREQDLAITLDSIGDAVIATDAEGMVTRMNPIAEMLTGWTLNDAKGQSLKDIFPIVNASTREPIENPIEKVISKGEIVYLSNHTTLIAKDGTEYQIADSAAPISNHDKEIIGMVLVFNDITEQYKLREIAAKSKRDMQAIMDYSPSIIDTKDLQGRYIFINQEWKKLFDKNKEDVIGKTDYEIFPRELADRFTRNDKVVLKTGGALKLEGATLLEEEARSYVSVKFPLFDESGNVYAVCGIYTDMTEFKQQEEQLRRSQKMDALGKLTGGVAHDYNNMLGVILGYSELLTGMLKDKPNLANYANEIHRAGERGAQLTNKLLSFTRKKSTNAMVLSINELLQNIQNILEKTLTARITLVLDLVNEVWPVYLDGGDFEDAIVNMSINAMHAIDGNGRLTIQTRNESLNKSDAELLQIEAGDYVLLSITDTGSGMNSVTKDKLFEPFFSTKGDSGTGLGLSQVYGFVERSGGVIKVYTEQNQGTRFTLYFPRRFEREGEGHVAKDLASVDLSGTGNILIVDDEPALITLTSTILSKQGYQIFSASSGKKALKILEKESIDLLLTDVIMPEMDGYQLASVVQQKYPHIKIQMASGFSDDRHINIEDDHLHKDLLHKPYNSETLLLRMRELLS